MSLKQDILSAQKEAMKARNTDTLSVLRLLGSAIKNKEIDLGRDLSDEEIVAVVSTLVKQSKDAQKEFEAAGRDDLAAQSTQEIAVLSQYLPPQLSEEEIRKEIQAVIDRLGENAQMGAVMGQVMQAVKGKADGNLVRQLVSGMLG